MAWEVTGNEGTNASADFLGTTDDQPLVIRTNKLERLRVEVDGQLSIKQNVTVGAGGNAELKTRFVQGKDWQTDNNDALYLNWATGTPVYLGNPGTNHSELIVSGDATIGAGSSGVLKTRFVQGKDWQSDSDDALYLNWATGKPVYLGNPGTNRSALIVSGDATVGADGTGGLTVNGVITAQDVILSSDSRLKSDVRALVDPLDRLRRLRGVSFQWLGTEPDAEESRSVGVLAQEVEAVFPELVSQPASNGMRGVHYPGLSAVLIEACKELAERVERLEESTRRDSA
jgi:hypothetical protein